MENTRYKISAVISAAILTAALSISIVSPLKAREVAIQGYDPVAYFTNKKPVKGSDKYTLTWNDITWQFSSEQNRKKFQSQPKKYAPQYNGWCAYAVSSGYVAEIDPINGWSFHKGKLYLNWNSGIKFLWKTRKDHYIQRADQNWPDLHQKIAARQIEINRK